MIKLTGYFTNNVLRKRPEISVELVEQALANPVYQQTQLDGRIRVWTWLPERAKYLRVVLLPDGSVLNAFFDRDFKEPL